VCIVTEHNEPGESTQNRTLQLPQYPPNRIAVVSYTVANATTAAFLPTTRYIGFKCTAIAYFQIAATEAGAESGLTSTSFPSIAADTWFWIGVPPGWYIAFYDGSS
jgi:hypothetical protein